MVQLIQKKMWLVKSVRFFIWRNSEGERERNEDHSPWVSLLGQGKVTIPLMVTVWTELWLKWHSLGKQEHKQHADPSLPFPRLSMWWCMFCMYVLHITLPDASCSSMGFYNTCFGVNRCLLPIRERHNWFIIVLIIIIGLVITIGPTLSIFWNKCFPTYYHIFTLTRTLYYKARSKPASAYYLFKPNS